MAPRTRTAAAVARRRSPSTPSLGGEHAADDHVVARRPHGCAVRDGQICAVTTYCNGGWDNELRARHAAEAPMIRP